MKYPKYRLAFPGKHVWVFNGHPMTQFNGYKLNTTAIGNGVVSADKSRGYYGESAQIFLSAAPYSTFSALSAQYGPNIFPAETLGNWSVSPTNIIRQEFLSALKRFSNKNVSVA